MFTLRKTLLNCFITLIHGFEEVYYEGGVTKQRTLLNYIEYFYKYLDKLVVLADASFDEETTVLIYELFYDIVKNFSKDIEFLMKETQIAENLRANLLLI